MAQITILGSGTVVPDSSRRSAAHLLVSGDVRLLLDCGSGTVHSFSQHGVGWADLTHIAITHYHTDHVSDLAALLQAFRFGQLPPRVEPLCLVGPPGFRAFLARLAAALGDHVVDPGFPLVIHEVAPGHEIELGGGVTLSGRSTPHTDESVAFLIKTPDGRIGYTGDTGPSDEVAAFLTGCRVLVAECSLPDASAIPTHLTPRSLADFASRALPELLVVTHVYPLTTPADAIGAVSKGYPGPCVAAWDGMRIRVQGAVTVDPPGTPV